MIQTFSFLREARQNPAFHRAIEQAMASPADSDLLTETLCLRFLAEEQALEVRPHSDDPVALCKILPKRISFPALRQLLAGDWDHLREEDITDL